MKFRVCVRGLCPRGKFQPGLDLWNCLQPVQPGCGVVACWTRQKKIRFASGSMRAWTRQKKFRVCVRGLCPRGIFQPGLDLWNCLQLVQSGCCVVARWTRRKKIHVLLRGLRVRANGPSKTCQRLKYASKAKIGLARVCQRPKCLAQVSIGRKAAKENLGFALGDFAPGANFNLVLIFEIVCNLFNQAAV